jgi:hypothetical protein
MWCDAAANAALGVCLLPNLLNFRVNNASFFWLYCAAWIVSALVRGWTAWNTEGAVRFIALGTGLTLLVIGILLASQILPDHWLAILAFGSYDGVCGLGYLATALALRNGRNAAPSET